MRGVLTQRALRRRGKGANRSISSRNGLSRLSWIDTCHARNFLGAKIHQSVLSSYGQRKPGRMDSAQGTQGVVDEKTEGAGSTPPNELESPVYLPNYDLTNKGPVTVKVIIIGDSGVGKSKLMERYLASSFKPRTMSTHSITLYSHETTVGGNPVIVDFWDTAGQERYEPLHKAYYFQSHACLLIFDATRKVSYKNLPNWYNELREHRPEIPVICAVNKIDANLDVTKTNFGFVEKNKFPFYFVSAADGTNVVSLFEDAIVRAVKYKAESTNWEDEILNMLESLSTST